MKHLLIMKDIIIKEKHIRRELYLILVSFVLAFVVNVGAIVAFDRPWSELYSQIGYVLFITVGIYVVLATVRIIIALLYRMFRK